MKTKITIILIVFTSIIGYSQTNEFAPIGAKWWYSFLTRDYDYNEIIPFYWESVGDTNILGKDCRIIKNFMDTNLCYEFYSYDNTLNYVYSEGNQVYYYNQFENNFYLLYNFNANIGDSWEIFIDSICSKTILIDSVHIINVNGISLRELYYHNNDTIFGQHYRIIENIGFTNKNFLIPEYNTTCNNSDFCDYNYYYGFGGFRCYIDSIIGEFHGSLSGEINNCEDTFSFYINVPEIQDLLSKFIIYPNPVKNIITVKSTIPMQNSFDVELYNCYGILILRKNNNINESSIDISFLPKGIYNLKTYNYETISTFKIVKE